MTDNRFLVRQRIEALESIPSMPETGRRLLELKDKPGADAAELAQIIALDPAISSQLVRYTQTPLFRFRKKSASIQDAIVVLGFDKSLQMALGFTSSQCFKIPARGPIGLQNYWKHAIYSATLCQMLAERMPDGLVDPGMAYLSGLLHNIGLLLLGHLFPHEFDVLNIKLKNKDAPPLVELEQQFMDASHSEIGVWLLRHWGLPVEIITAVYEHHNSEYRGPHHIYANLTLIADRCLIREGIGDSESSELPAKLLQALSLSEERVTEALAALMGHHDHLDSMIDSIKQAVSRRTTNK